MTIEDAAPGADDIDDDQSSEPPKLTLEVQFAAPAFAAHRKLLTKPVLTEWVRAAIFDDAALTLRFVDSDEGKVLNRTYRGKDYATNVLTFAYAESEEDPVTGDIVLCCPVVESEATEQGKPLLAHYAHLVIHGVLHAQGYEAIETELLESLGFPDPYADDVEDDDGAEPAAPRVLH